MDKNTTIPNIPHRFFKWYCRADMYEELHGDLEELFQHRLVEMGPRKARCYYLWDVLRCCQPYAWKETNFQLMLSTMLLKNYFKTSFRNLVKNPLTSFINIFGLAMAIGICLMVYSFFEFDASIDQFHENKEEVYLLTSFGDREGGIKQYGRTPRPLGNQLRTDFPQLKNVCQVEDRSAVLKYKNKVFQERIRFTNPSFLEMFTFPLKWGLASSLGDLNSIILSEKMAIKYFGKENPIGEEISVKVSDTQKKSFQVTGVSLDFPKARTIDFDFLLNIENLTAQELNYDQMDWSTLINGTLFQTDNSADIALIEQGLEKYRRINNEAQDDWIISAFGIEQLANLHVTSQYIIDDISFDAYGQGRISLPILALFMLILACFNYINIAIVSATKRLREIGVRKVMGASRQKVVFQFLTENIFVTFFALIVGILLAINFILPWFIGISEMDLKLSLLDQRLWGFLVVILLFTGIASGLYPAFYISKFDAVNILKGSTRFGNKNPLTKVFLGIQLILAAITITAGIIFTQNITYQNNRSWGYNQENTLYVHVTDGADFEKLRAAMSQDPNVLSIAGSMHHLGKSNTSTVIDMPDRQYEVDQLSIDAHYLETMGIGLKAGRSFQENRAKDRQTVVVNDLLVRSMGLKEPIGQIFKIDNQSYEIIGVTNDFHIYNFYHTIRPTIFKVAAPANFQYLSMKIKEGTQLATYKSIQNQWTSLFPDKVFQGGYQKDTWGGFFEETTRMANFNRTIGWIAILLASLGFYGLLSLNVSGRHKEFSIRKVLGAELKDVAYAISKQFIGLTVIALVISVPFSYVLVKGLLDLLYPYPMPIGFWGLAISILCLVFALFVVVFTQILKVVRFNPIEGLRGD